jgi:hypothetical protein
VSDKMPFYATLARLKLCASYSFSSNETGMVCIIRFASYTGVEGVPALSTAS